MMLDKISYESTAKTLNNATFINYYKKLCLLVLSLFEYENLPNNIKGYYIEEQLFFKGECMFFEDDNLGLMIAGLTNTGISEYDEPIFLNPVATNYKATKEYVNHKNAVLIRNNLMSLPSNDEVLLKAWRITNIKRSQDVNINAMKTPVIIKCSNKQLLTLKNVYKQYDGNEPVIFGDKDADMDNFKVFKTDAPIVFDKLQLQLHQELNEFLTFYGINNANQDKKERLVADEVTANNESVICFFNTMLEAREEAVKEINKLFSLDIKVKKRADIAEYAKSLFNEDMKEVS